MGQDANTVNKYKPCSKGVVYVHLCMLACTYCHSNACQFTAYTPNMQAVHTCSRAAQSMYVYLHRHVCMWSTRASRAVHVYLQDANASNVRFAAHVARVCTDVRTRVCAWMHTQSLMSCHTLNLTPSIFLIPASQSHRCVVAG